MRRVNLKGVFLLLIAGVIGFLFFFYGKPFQKQEEPIRALWVTRFDYTTAEDVRKIVQNVAAAGFTDLFFQIRGNGTVFYASQLEPWASELSGGNIAELGRDPGWDPLQLALDTAKPHGLRVHAYINVLPGWRGLEEPPVAAQQLWTVHPDWFMVDSLGQKMLPTAGWYSFINPVLPAVRMHLCKIVSELCVYDVAGIHLDYIRYPNDYCLVAAQRYPDASEEELLQHADFSYDVVSKELLQSRYGPEVSPQEQLQFRCDSVSQVVQDLLSTLQTTRPSNCVLSASVMGNPVEGKWKAYQDSGLWVKEGWVDWAVQMNYGTRSFDPYLRSMREATGRRGFKNSVVVGLNCKNEVAELVTQMDKVAASGARGVALFSYTYLFDATHHKTEKGRILLAKIRP